MLWFLFIVSKNAEQLLQSWCSHPNWEKLHKISAEKLIREGEAHEAESEFQENLFDMSIRFNTNKSEIIQLITKFKQELTELYTDRANHEEFQTPLVYAVMMQNSSAVDALLETNFQLPPLNFPLIALAAQYSTLPILKSLLAKGYDPNIPNLNTDDVGVIENTPLFYSIVNNDLSMVQAILEHEAFDISRLDEFKTLYAPHTVESIINFIEDKVIQYSTNLSCRF